MRSAMACRSTIGTRHGAQEQREQIVVALITDLRDAAGAQRGFVTSIENGRFGPGDCILNFIFFVA